MTALALVFAAAAADAAPVLTTGSDPTSTISSVDVEWAARARNFDNRGGTWKPIVFGDDLYSNNANAVSSLANWTITSNTVSGRFSLTFVQTSGPSGSASFSTGDHSLTNPNVGVDTDATDGPITDLLIFARDSADSEIQLTNLSLAYGANTVNLGGVNTPGGAGNTNAFLHVTNLLAAFGTGFTLTGDYSVAHDGSVSDEAPRFEITALSGGSIDQGSVNVPEPATLALLGAGLLGLGIARRHRAA